MLKHEDTPELLSPPAAQARVTPEELAQALSRIEARKDAGQRQADGTISIGEAVQQLGVDTTPEEVLAEVQAIRQEPMRTEGRRVFSRQRLALLSGLGLGMIGLVGWWSVPHVAERQAPPAIATPLPAPQAAPKSITLDPNLMVQDASGKIVMLSEVGDNQPVQCFYNEDDRNFQSYSSDASGAPEDWTLIKHGGQTYVRGWIDPMSEQALAKNGANIGTWESNYNDTEASHFTHKRITLPLTGFQVGAGGNIDKEFHALNIHLDKYAYEKWQP